ncbi:hypothetical protein F5148DRAFT_401249 [Russula earlei]|uniref:Uncharacterized protein n=2 Tax=Russula earlei TaxID=71964 RepID=A0ACC0TZQ6_9AGAM|nr:hypothetical protein F5148DRAFT_401107 [Russula earlei]KAI9455051.1 hypothetical protein F5148DRAFT_401249 [Russula earlei]
MRSWGSCTRILAQVHRPGPLGRARVRGARLTPDQGRDGRRHPCHASPRRLGVWWARPERERQYTLSLATQANAQPLPAVPEVFGLRLPPAKECLTAIDFDFVPNRPPLEEKQYDEDIEEIVESASEDDEEDMEPAAIPDAAATRAPPQSQATSAAAHRPPVVTVPVNTARTPSDDVEMADTSAAVAKRAAGTSRWRRLPQNRGRPCGRIETKTSLPWSVRNRHRSQP